MSSDSPTTPPTIASETDLTVGRIATALTILDALVVGVALAGVAGNGPEVKRRQQLYKQAIYATAEQQGRLGQARAQTASPWLPERYANLVTLPYAWIAMTLVAALVFLLRLTPVLIAATTFTPAITRGTP